MIQYWHREELRALETITSFEEMAQIAIGILARMAASRQEVVQICGPMSTGGFGSLEANMAYFRRAVDTAHEKGMLVFDQSHFQDCMIRLCNLKKERDEYDWEILHVFYTTIFETRHFGRFLFLPGWEKSTGARWERSVASNFGIIVQEYPIEWLP